MISLRMSSKTVNALAALIAVDLARYKNQIVPKLAEAGNLVRRKERQLLRGSAGPRVVGQQSRDRMGRFTKKRTKGSKGSKRPGTSRLLSQHRVVIRWERNQWVAFVGPTPAGRAFYGKFHETGTGERVTSGGARRGALPARPWMKPAIEATEEKVEQILAGTFRAFRIVK